MLPKFMLEGLAARKPGVAGGAGVPETGAVPVPASVSLDGELDASLMNEMPPELVPDPWGAKVTVKETLCPAVSVTGKLMPLTEYP